MTMLPNDPITAVTFADPYPYYRIWLQIIHCIMMKGTSYGSQPLPTR